MSSQQQLFTINGLVDTNKNVWQNLEALASSSAAFVTWSPYTFQYGVVINEPGSSVRSFTDDNIIGAINITETPFDELYNSCEVSFPNRDIRDKVDTVRYDSPVADRYDFEPDNRLNIQFDFVNDSVQAEVIALTELKQSRVNRSISFATDFTNMDLEPGDVIDITNEYYGWTAELFRIIEITQIDTVNGELLIEIIAIKYDSTVYDYNGITRYTREIDIDLPAIQNNTTAQTTNDETVGTQVGRALATDTGKAAITAGGVPVYDSLELAWSTTQVDTAFNASNTLGGILNITTDVKSISMIFESPQGTIDYDVYIDEVQESRQYLGNAPVYVELQYSVDNTSYSAIKARYVDWAATGLTFNLTDAVAGYYQVAIALADTLDLDQDVPTSITGTDKSSISITGITSVAETGSTDAMKVTWVILQ